MPLTAAGPGDGRLAAPGLVSAAPCPDYDLARVRQALRDLLAPWGGMAGLVRPGQRVLVKPNLLAARPPADAVTTHPALVQAVAEAVWAAGAFPFIGDAPGAPTTAATLERVYRITDMAGAAARSGAPLNTDTDRGEWANPDARWLRQIPIWRAVADADAIVSLSKLKTHNLTVMTGAVKNCYGLIPSPDKTQLHMRWPRPDDFSEMLLDLCLRAEPVLHLMDAVVGMEGDGPSAGRPRQVGALLASRDALALDVAMAALVGCRPALVTTTAAGLRRGLTTARPEDLPWVGPPWQELQVQGFRPASAWLVNNPLTLQLLGLGGRLVAPRPHVGPRCIGCGVCARHCPADAIVIRDGRAVIDRGRCIRCFCCQELCPEQAMEVQRPGLADWATQRLTSLRRP
ncbi:MAG: DUF362 domain-containing protein [Chloroflexi bacterium]|nr:DUF362 domain-containing protein [Chloroflexota bacterium]